VTMHRATGEPGVSGRDLDSAVAPGGRLLRHRPDVEPVLFVLGIAVVQAALYLQPSAPAAALGALVLWPLQTRSIYVAHNHHHHRVFRWRGLNLAFETLLFLQTGMPSYGSPCITTSATTRTIGTRTPPIPTPIRIAGSGAMAGV